jgi:hypothetical protein
MESLLLRLARYGAKAIETRLNSISGGNILDDATERGEFIQSLLHRLIPCNKTMYRFCIIISATSISDRPRSDFFAPRLRVVLLWRIHL